MPAQRSANASYSRMSVGTDAHSADPVEGGDVDERPQHHRELVARVRADGFDPELLGQAVTFEQAEDRLGVAYIDREEHQVSDTKGV